MSQTYLRPLPRIDDENAFHWTSGKEGVMRVSRCQSCSNWIHPVQPICSKCHSRDIKPEVVSGKGTVFTYTVNVKPWGAGMKIPYVIAVVRLDEQDDLQMTTNIIGCDAQDVHIGMPVEVEFEQDEDVYLPMFRPQS